MTPEYLADTLARMMYATAELALPLLGTALVVGLIVSIFQAATQINENTLTFLPKIAAMIAVFILASSWMITKIRDYTINVFETIPLVARR